MKCSLPPHGVLTFDSFDDFEVHYQKTHLNRCTECANNFPDHHYLSLHISENHDPIVAAKRDGGEKTYACLATDCERLCSTAFKRRLHCIDKHGFPKNYDFFIVDYGIDRRSSMLRSERRKGSTSVSTGNKTNSEVMDVVQDDDEEEQSKDESMTNGEEVSSPKSPSRAPIVLRGRGGFSHPPRGGGRGRDQRSRAPSTSQAPASAAPTATVPTPATADPMDSLTSSMSALQFIPRSVRGRGRGKGRGSH
ncbi:hypothetical protein EJ04DRAFT_507764 [Polyplosphaeria fusca]|uniref:C2H2-type domain-containing protein n=1 Tax=Polyplosphaeria fusca TaxID=682080 RepID=A0A9P4R7N1_9PLEO|nr:hypothetical protein EJ04DRAFT_507764 [Polyplosphaeria fusca]